MKASSDCKIPETYLRGMDQRSCVVNIYMGAFYQVPSSLYLKMSYFTSIDETPACEKIIHVDIGYKSVTSLNQHVNEKILKISRLL